MSECRGCGGSANDYCWSCAVEMRDKAVANTGSKLAQVTKERDEARIAVGECGRAIAQNLRDINALGSRVEALANHVRNLYSEVDCRIEHGVETGGHLEYVREQLRGIKQVADA